MSKKNTSSQSSQAVVGELLKAETKSNAISRKSGSAKVRPTRKSGPTEIRRLGKDELNLIEHPFAILWQKEANDAVIFYQWDTKHPVNGRVIPASWMVSGHRDFGLPNAADERVYLVLLEVTREAGFEQQNVTFSRYDLLQRLGWGDDKRSYDMLERAFERLQGVTITAKNAFWNPKSRSFVNTGFNIIDNYHIESERPGRKASGQRELPVSFWRWNDVIFASFQSGYLRSLDLDFALSLKSDIALRLYRYLDKKAYAEREHFEIELFNLCIRHLGMKPNRYPSKLKERLKPAHDELIERGFLQSFEYQPMKTQKAVKVCYRFAPRGQDSLKALETSEQERVHREQSSLLLIEPVTAENLEDEVSNSEASNGEASNDEASEALCPQLPETDAGPQVAENQTDEWSPDQRALLERMAALKVSPDVAHQLLRDIPSEDLQLQLACLADREPRDSAATFVKAVRENWALPGKYLERLKAQEDTQKAKAYQQAEEVQKAAQAALAAQETASQQAETEKLDDIWETLDASTRESIENQARQRLGVLGQSGRAQGALHAMRRNLLRERLG